MTREEYLKRKKEGTCDSMVIPKIKSKAEYILTMKGIEDFIDNNKIDYTEEDYEAFDNNFEDIIDFITDNNVDFGSIIHKSIEMMKAIDWKWAGSANNSVPTFDIFLGKIKKLYEDCLSHQRARYYSSTCGIDVSIDIYRHKVEVTFGNINEVVYDE